MKETREKIRRTFIIVKEEKRIGKPKLGARQNRKGITLIALVVTIVVLLILAGITVNLLFGNGGIFDIANQSKPAYEIGALKDRINNVIADWYIDKGIDQTTVIDDLWDKMVVEDIIDNPEEDVEGPEKVGENDRYDITSNEGYVVEIIVAPDGNVSIGNVVKEDSLPPKVGEIVSSSTSNSIHIEVEITRSKGEINLSYYYKKEGEADSSYQTLKEEVTELIADFTGLEQKAIYNIKIVVTDENGTTNKIVNVMTGELTGRVTQKGETIWNNGTATIELETKETGVTIQYQVGGTEGKWIDYEGPITGLKYGDTVFAVITDGTNQSGYSSINIIDKINPQQAQIKLSSKNTTTAESITATVTHIDNESGIEISNCRWVYNTNASAIGTEISSYPSENTFSSNGQTITLSATTVGTYYLHVLTQDKAGNKTETISQPITVTLPNNAPVISSVSFNSKTTNSITVNAQATDADNNNLIYTLYTSTLPSSGFTQGAASSATTSGSTVTLTASGLSQYTNYYYYVSVTDGKETIQSSTSSAVRTYCPGTGLTCPGGTTQIVACPYCDGRYGVGTRCSECGGTSWHNNPTTYCPLCGARGTRVKVVKCSMCSYGDYRQTVPCSHGSTYSHSYCSHGYTSQHD
jgi:hypothetical protein